jgi:hypothetical protein
LYPAIVSKYEFLTGFGGSFTITTNLHITADSTITMITIENLFAA